MLGPAVLGVGIWFFVTSPFQNTRAQDITNMNNIIQEWNSNYYSQFSNQNFTVLSEISNKTVNFTTNSSPELSDSDLVSYTPLRYQEKGGIIPTQTYFDNLTAVITISGIGKVPIVVFQSNQSSDSESVCNANGGDYVLSSPPYCSYFYRISSLCIKVSQKAGAWALDNSYGGVGCLSITNFQPEILQKIPFSGSFIDTPISFSDVTITIRSQQDPFIYAQWLTNGSLNFGLTPGQRAIIGLALIGVGAFFTLPCIACCFFIGICFFRRRHLHHYERI